jgi:hypothetical protein
MSPTGGFLPRITGLGACFARDLAFGGLALGLVNG